MRQVKLTQFVLIIFTIITTWFLSTPAEANMLPPQRTGFSSGSLSTAKTQDAKMFRVDKASLTVQCQDNCRVKAEYRISSRQSAEVVLVFVLAQNIGLEVAVNGEPVPVSTTSALNLREHLVPENDIFRRLAVKLVNPEERLYAATFKAHLISDLNTVLVTYKQSYNRANYDYKNAIGHWNTIREFRYEFWPLQNWYLADSFTMTVNAEFVISSPLEDELLVHASEWPRSTSSAVERFTPTGEIMTYKKEWKHNFPGRILWFIGDKNQLDVSKGFVHTSITR